MSFEISPSTLALDGREVVWVEFVVVLPSGTRWILPSKAFTGIERVCSVMLLKKALGSRESLNGLYELARIVEGII